MQHTNQAVALFVLTAMLATAGCGGAVGDPQPLLETIGKIKMEVGEILTAIEAGDTKAADGPMHVVGPLVKNLPAVAAQAGLSASAFETFKTSAQSLFDALNELHGPLHGHGTLADLDIPALTSSINESLASLEASLPAGWEIPAIAADEEGHGDEGHEHGESHAGHDHGEDHDHAAHDNADATHSEEHHEDGDHEDHDS